MHGRYLIIICILLISFRVNSQKTLSFSLFDSRSNEPVPFANILYGSLQKGTMSNINGQFILKTDSSYTYIRISCLGYRPVILQTQDLNDTHSLYLDPVDIELSQVDIMPGKNPALTIMESVYANRNKNNPDKAVNYSCRIYHKMSFYLDIPDSIDSKDKEIKKMVEFNRKNYLFLIESVSEKKHLAPDKTNEELISGRVSGLEQPTLAMLPAQIQPFTFYSDYIRLLDTDFLNPISQQGLRQYRFLLKDTILTNEGDTLYYISFEPGKLASFRGMKGSLHVHVPSYAINTVSAETVEGQGSISLSIKQNYIQTALKCWFPDQLESRLRINTTVTGQTFPYPLVGKGESTITNVNINPEFNKKDFSNIQFVDKASDKKASPIEVYRYVPLSDKDLSTYRLIDSLGRKQRLDAMINFQKNLIEGYIPLGSFKLDVKKLIDLNEYEGLKLGLGLWTGDKISDNFSTGGYYVRSFKSRDNNFGGGVRFLLNKTKQREWNIYIEHCLKETGSFSFLDGYAAASAERFKRYFIETMDPTSSFFTSFKTRFLQYFKSEIFYHYNESKPVVLYPFFSVNTPLQDSFSNHESGIKMRWAHKETFALTHFGLTSNGTKYPVVWANFSAGNGSQGGAKYDYKKYEAQIEESFRPVSSVKTLFRITAGCIQGSYPASKLYSTLGTNMNGTGVDIPFTFATMYPNEFAASEFTSFFFRNTFFTRLNKPGNFKPEITVVSSVGIGDLDNYHGAYTISTINKGYYESGIYFGNLLRQLIFKYGFSVYYRYGPYKLPNEADNWSFKIGLEIGL